MTQEQIDNTFTYHKPITDQTMRYEALRKYAREMAVLINNCCPESREKSLAFTHLQEAVMFANAAIAINERERPAETLNDIPGAAIKEGS